MNAMGLVFVRETKKGSRNPFWGSQKKRWEFLKTDVCSLKVPCSNGAKTKGKPFKSKWTKEAFPQGSAIWDGVDLSVDVNEPVG